MAARGDSSWRAGGVSLPIDASLDVVLIGELTSSDRPKALLRKIAVAPEYHQMIG